METEEAKRILEKLKEIKRENPRKRFFFCENCSILYDETTVGINGGRCLCGGRLMEWEFEPRKEAD